MTAFAQLSLLYSSIRWSGRQFHSRLWGQHYWRFIERHSDLAENDIPLRLVLRMKIPADVSYKCQ